MGDDIEASETSVVAFRCNRKLKAAIEERAQDEGLSLGAVARRAVLRDLRRPAGAVS